MKAILLFALSVIMLSQSYGFAYADHGGHHYAVVTGSSVDGTVTIGIDSSSYQEGEVINISGSVSDYIESDPFKNFDVTLKVIAPNNNIISISQIPLNSDGSYSTFILAQGPLWKFDGDYTIYVSHGSDDNASAIFTFISIHEEVIEEVIEVTEEVIEIPEEELAKGCGAGTHLEGGVCVLDETVSVSTGSSPTVGGNALIYSITFTVLIAFVIMIILYLISRASRTKTV